MIRRLLGNRRGGLVTDAFISSKITHLFEFEENLGATTIYESKKGLTASNNAGASGIGVLHQQGINGKAIKLENNANFICDYPLEFRMNNNGVGIPFSFGCWIKKHGLGSQNWLLYKRISQAVHADYYAYWSTANKIIFVLAGDVELFCGTPIITDVGISNQEYFHYLFTHDGSNNASGMKAYLNGVNGSGNSNNAVTSFKYNNHGIQMGKADYTNAYPFNGTLDQVFWAKGHAFSPEDALKIYNNGNGLIL